MADELKRIEALEQFAIRITRLAGTNWVTEETASAIAEANENPANEAALQQTAALIAKGAAYQKAFEAKAQQPSNSPAAPQTQPPVNQNDILRRNTLLLDWYEREVGISKSYTTVISGAGYAGLLAIWNGLRDHIDKVTVLGSAALIGISLAVFVFWEMMKSSLTAQASAAFDQVVKDKFMTPDFEVASGVVRANNIARSSALNRYQPLIFWISTVTGFVAAAWLVIASACSAAGIKITFQMG